jgi:hypothetical protein
MLIDLPARTDPKYVGWALARESYTHPGVVVEHGTAQAVFDPEAHVFTLRVEGHAPVVVTATGPRSTRVVGAPPPTRYDAFYYLAEGFTTLAFDPTAPNQAFAERG